MKVHRIVVGALQANCYICWCELTKQAVIIDPGDEPQRLLSWLKLTNLELSFIILTHFHFDHTQGAGTLRTKTGASISIHIDDAPLLENQPALFKAFAGSSLAGLRADNLLIDSDFISFGQESLRVISTPGHSPGGICLYHEQDALLFAGDSLFRAGVGRTDFPGCDSGALASSIRERLLCLPEKTVVYPGHGPSTTIGYEKQFNPFI